jgi:hypothetical protein
MMPFANPAQTAYFSKIVMEDTNNPTLANDGGTTFREYLDNSNEWQDYLRSLFYVYDKRNETGTSNSSKLPRKNWAINFSYGCVMASVMRIELFSSNKLLIDEG